MKRNQSGFTLVVIAIVLVIIGLLLGGLLQSGQITDPKEWHFLNEKLKQLERKGAP